MKDTAQKATTNADVAVRKADTATRLATKQKEDADRAKAALEVEKQRKQAEEKNGLHLDRWPQQVARSNPAAVGKRVRLQRLAAFGATDLAASRTEMSRSVRDRLCNLAVLHGHTSC